MKYCSKCGKQIHEDAVICVHCGCATGNGAPTGTPISPSGTAQARGSGVVVKNNLGRLWLASILGGLLFGVAMCLAIGVIGLLAGVLFAVLFGLIMQITVSHLEKSPTWAAKRAEISQTKTIIVEGAANLDGNGGWLFVTDQGVEYYTHKMNFDNRTLIFTNDQISTITKEGSKLVIVACNTKYKFVVNYVDTWLQYCGR